MRIIAGEYRSRKLLSPEGFSTRPIPDRVKESFFGMLGSRVEGARVVDLFAGSGAIGLEALSRGAASCMFVEQEKDAEAVLRKNIEALRCEARSTVVRGDALGLSVPARCPQPVDLIFMDPPYPLVRQRLGWERIRQQAAALASLLAVEPPGFLVIRTPWPFLVSEDDAGGGRSVAGRGKRTSRRGKHGREQEKPRRTRFIDEDGDVMEPVDDWGAREEAGDAEEAGETAGEPSGVPADLSITGCTGPETHRYGTTAVHWYARARGG